MKAQLRKYFLLFIRERVWLPLIVIIIPYFAFAEMRPVPIILYMWVYLFFLYAALWHRISDRRSGWQIYESFSPLKAEDRVFSEYLAVFVSMAVYTLVSMLGGTWLYRLFRLFPLLALVPAALILPWHYLVRNEKVLILADVCGAIFTYSLFAIFADIPLTVVHYPLWLLLMTNLGCAVLFVFSSFLAVIFAKKRGIEL